MNNQSWINMLNISKLHIAFAVIAITAISVQAHAINKCVVNGSVTYQQAPCPSGKARKAPTLEELNAAEKSRRSTKKPTIVEKIKETAQTPTSISARFSCDSRTHCSQMKSCEEAKYFLAHCPAAKMDGDKNGIPCEKQWCN